MHEGYNMALCRIYYTKYVGKNFIPTYVYRSTHLVKKKMISYNYCRENALGWWLSSSALC